MLRDLPVHRAPAAEPAISPFVPKSDTYRFDANPNLRTESELLNVLANDKGSNLRIVSLETRQLKIGKAAISPDRKKIEYT
jgi:hypothetical protein